MKAKELEKIKKYLKEKLNEFEKELFLCCDKQGFCNHMKDYLFLTEIVFDLIEDEIKKTNVLSKKELKETIRRMNIARKIIKILKAIPNVIWNKIEQAIRGIK